MIIDMRGSTWQIVKPILKVLQVFFIEINISLIYLLIQTSSLRSKPRLYCHVTVELSLFMGHQCLWISWVVLAHKFPSPQMYNKVMNRLTLQLQKTI